MNGKIEKTRKAPRVIPVKKHTRKNGEAVCLREYEEIMEERYNITESIFEDEKSFREIYESSGEKII